ncbi:MAG TPA: hypothetical protein VMG10_14350 [Gemmataceae bacterium]|nr:hypothetical protein [Gemmataceae bacterium]
MGGASRPIGGGQKVGQPVHGAREVVQPAVRVAGRQRERAMAGQLLQRPQVDAGASSKRQVGVPERVKVGEERPVRSLDRVGDAGGVEVAAQHFRALAVPSPRPRPDGQAGRLVAEVAAQQLGHVGRDRLHLQHARLVPPSRQRGRRRRGRQIEGLRRQAGQCRGTKARSASRGVKVETIRAGQTAKRPFALGGGGQQPAQFVLRQLAAVVPAVQPVVACFQVRQGIGGGAMVLHQPTGERFDVREVLVRRLHAHAATETILQRLHRGAGEPPGLALSLGGEPMTADGGPHGRGLDAEQRGGFSRREPFLSRRQRRGGPVAAQLGEVVHDPRRR